MKIFKVIQKGKFKIKILYIYIYIFKYIKYIYNLIICLIGYYKCLRNSNELYEKMQRTAINDHIVILNLLKQFFQYIKYNDSNKDKLKYFDLSSHLNEINKLKNESSSLYQKLIQMNPDNKVIIKLLFIFIYYKI